MRIGWAKQNITPPMPVHMAGYGDRKGPSKGVSDSLFAKAIVLEDDKGEKITLVSNDLLFVTKRQVEIIRTKANELTGIKREHIIINATHTHAGPLTYENPFFGEYNDTYVECLIEVIPSLILQASNKIEECKLGWYQSKVEDIGANRRNPDMKSDTFLTVLSFVDLRGKPLAVMFNYNCHPTVLSAENVMISAEYPGAAAKLLEKIYGEDALFMFSNGACGDISTRFTRRSQTFEEKDRLGRILASEVIKGIEKIKYKEQSYIALIEKSFKLKERVIPEEEELNKKIKEYQNKLQELKNNNANNGEIRIATTNLQGSIVLKMLKKYRGILEYEGSMSVIRLGEGCIVTQPAELFSKLGNQIMEESPFAPTMIMGYTNGSIGYIPDKTSYVEGGYESLSCRFEYGAGEELANIAIGLIKELKNEV